jgi:hypothetical protein
MPSYYPFRAHNLSTMRELFPEARWHFTEPRVINSNVEQIHQGGWQPYSLDSGSFRPNHTYETFSSENTLLSRLWELGTSSKETYILWGGEPHLEAS